MIHHQDHSTLYGAAIGIQPRCRGRPTPKATFKPPRSSCLAREAAPCSYFHIKATQTLLLFLTLLLAESICAKLPREIPQSSPSHFMPTQEGKELPPQTASQLLQASPQPPEFENHSAQPRRGLHASRAGTAEPPAGISKGTQPRQLWLTLKMQELKLSASSPSKPLVNLLFYRKPC